jgi:transcriptional regulator with XRE-family HTH domain
MTESYDREATIGARLRVLRRWRGMTQAQLAGLANLSPSFVSMVETGQRPLDRRSHIGAIASALKVSETDLAGGPHLSADRLQSDPHMGIPALRAAILGNTLTSPVTERARALADLAREVAGEVRPACRDADYLRAGELLPSLIDELHVHAAGPADEAARRLALETLVDACVAAEEMACVLGYADLAHAAAARALEAAAVLGDPVQQGKAAWAHVMALPGSGMPERKLAVAERAARQLEPHVRDAVGVQVLGMLTLTAAMAAMALRQGATAGAWLDEAAALAGRVPDTPMVSWQLFSATNVGIWRVQVGCERGLAGAQMLELAGQVDVSRVSAHSQRRAAFLADVGRGLARDPRTRREAVRWLRQGETAAPQWIRNNPAARETVTYLLGRATAAAGGRELRGMAARMGMPR